MKALKYIKMIIPLLAYLSITPVLVSAEELPVVRVMLENTEHQMDYGYRLYLA